MPRARRPPPAAREGGAEGGGGRGGGVDGVGRGRAAPPAPHIIPMPSSMPGAIGGPSSLISVMRHCVVSTDAAMEQELSTAWEKATGW